jgi:hypothetical protein
MTIGHPVWKHGFEGAAREKEQQQVKKPNGNSDGPKGVEEQFIECQNERAMRMLRVCFEWIIFASRSCLLELANVFR